MQTGGNISQPQTFAKLDCELDNSLKEVRDLKAALDEHAIVAITDSQGKITFVNEKFCAISKYTREELLGHDHRIINSGHHTKEFIRGLWTTISHGRVWKGEIKNKAKDGTFYWVDTTIVPFLNEQGKPRQYVAIRADITERKRADEARMQLAAIVNSSDDAIIGKTLEGIITSWNPGAERMFGYSADEVIGKSMLILFPPERLHEEKEILMRIGRGECVKHFETVRLHKNRTPIDVSVTLSPITDSEGKIIGASKIARDIKERKLAEEEMRKFNAELEHRVTERTAQLETANKELEAFSYSVSHDLRSPLRGIHGYVRMLKEDYAGHLDPEGNRLLDVVGSEAKRMGQLIDDLLTFSRMGRQKMGATTFDLSTLARSEFDALTRATPQAAPRFEIGPMPSVSGDPAMLRQVFANLIGNAIKFTRHQLSPVIEVGSWGDDSEVTIYIRDNGAGFDEKHRHKLFGVFQRLHSEAEFEGTGVGLALVQRIIHRHGGHVWAEGKPNLGATFYFTLPKLKVTTI
jgi:PAS domain S-box-containing protein